MATHWVLQAFVCVVVVACAMFSGVCDGVRTAQAADVSGIRMRTSDQTAFEVQATQYFEEGRRLTRDGHWGDARRAFLAALRLEPEHRWAALYLRRLTRMENWAAGGLGQEGPVRVSEDQPDILAPMVTSKTQSAAGQLPLNDEVLEEARRYLRSHEGRLQGLWQVGVSHLEAGAYEDAIIEFEILMGVDPTSNYARMAARQLPIAEEGLRRIAVVAAQPTLTPAERSRHIMEQYDLGRALYREGKYGPALNAFEMVLRLDPQHSSAERFRDRAHRLLNEQAAEAVANIPEPEGETTVEPLTGPVDAMDVGELYSYARGLYRDGDFAAALAAVEGVLNQEPTHSGAKRYRDRAQKQLAEHTAEAAGVSAAKLEREHEAEALRAREAKEAAAERDKQLQQAYREGQEHVQAGRDAAAVTVFKPLLAQLEPESVKWSTVDRLIRQAEHRLEVRAREQAEQEAAAARHALAAEHTATLNDAFDRGRELYSQGNYAAALEAFNAVLRLDPAHTGAQRYRDRTELKLEREVLDAANAARTEIQQQAGERVDPPPLGAQFAERVQRAPDAGIQELIAQASVHMQQGQYAMAVTVYEEVLTIDAENADARRGRTQAQMSLDLELTEAARRAAQPSDQATPVPEPDAEAPVDEAAIETAARDAAEQAETQLAQREAEALDAKVAALLQEAEVARQADEHARAVAMLRAALALNPEHRVATRMLKQSQKHLDKELAARTTVVQAAQAEATEWTTRRQAMILDDVQHATHALERADRQRAEEEAEALAQAALEEPLTETEQAMKTALAQSVTVDFDNVDLVSVLDYLADSTSVNIIPSNAVVAEARKATIRIKEMPLHETLRYLVRTHGLKMRVADEVIWVATAEEVAQERLETRVFFLEQGVGLVTNFGEGESNVTTLGAGPPVSETRTLKDVIEASVDFPKGGNLVMDERTGALIVSNTPDNLDIIADILATLDHAPMQVEIEARFMEVTLTDLHELGMEASLTGAWGVQKKATGNKSEVTSPSGVDFSSTARASEGFNLTFRGVLTHPQFQVVLHALEERQSVNTLSAPRVTTLNNQAAMIEVVDDFIYPSRFEVSFVPEDQNGDGTIDPGEGDFINLPQDFVTRKLGILLNVTPTVSHDGEMIALSLVPEVSDFLQFDTFGGQVSLPRFTSRSLTTSAIVKNGETVVLGGLMREIDVAGVDKIPLLANVPLLGRMFQKKTDNTTQRNLLIFVTARLIQSERTAKRHSLARADQAGQTSVTGDQ